MYEETPVGTFLGSFIDLDELPAVSAWEGCLVFSLNPVEYRSYLDAPVEADEAIEEALKRAIYQTLPSTIDFTVIYYFNHDRSEYRVIIRPRPGTLLFCALREVPAKNYTDIAISDWVSWIDVRKCDWGDPYFSLI